MGAITFVGGLLIALLAALVSGLMLFGQPRRIVHDDFRLAIGFALGASVVVGAIGICYGAKLLPAGYTAVLALIAFAPMGIGHNRIRLWWLARRDKRDGQFWRPDEVRRMVWFLHRHQWWVHMDCVSAYQLDLGVNSGWWGFAIWRINLRGITAMALRQEFAPFGFLTGRNYSEFWMTPRR